MATNGNNFKLLKINKYFNAAKPKLGDHFLFWDLFVTLNAPIAGVHKLLTLLHGPLKSQKKISRTPKLLKFTT